MIKRAVSLYSFQDKYARKKLRLEDMFRYMSEWGTEGVELLSDQMIPGSPFPSDDTLSNWKKLLGESGIHPVCNDIFVDSNLYRNRELTKKEQVRLLCDEIRNSHDLGFRLVKLASKTSPYIVEPVMPLCGQLGVAVAFELHGGMSLDHPGTRACLDVVKGLASPYCGIVVDCGIFCRKFPRVVRDHYLRNGVNPELAKYIDDAFLSGSDFLTRIQKDGRHKELIMTLDMLPDGVKPLIKNDIDFLYARNAQTYENTPLERIDEYMPYLKHIHGKCYEMSPQLEETSIRYEEIVEYLKEREYEGYIATEYEGSRYFPEGQSVDDVGNTRLHQAMLAKLLKSGANSD